MLLMYCLFIQASNYDPNAISDSGTCTYLYQDPETGSKKEGTLGDFVTTTVGSLFGNKGDTSGPNWEGTGYAYSGDIVSQRDIDRLVRYFIYSWDMAFCPTVQDKQIYNACTVYLLKFTH